MNTKEIESTEIESIKISSLPTRPTARCDYGGVGYSAIQMKAAFDALPLFIIERLNSLISDIKAEPESSVSGEIKTGISVSPTLKSFFDDIVSGALASYLTVGTVSLATQISEILERLEALEVLAETEGI